jgi:hypothetical protein
MMSKGMTIRGIALALFTIPMVLMATAGGSATGIGAIESDEQARRVAPAGFAAFSRAGTPTIGLQWWSSITSTPCASPAAGNRSASRINPIM